MSTTARRSLLGDYSGFIDDPSVKEIRFAVDRYQHLWNALMRATSSARLRPPRDLPTSPIARVEGYTPRKLSLDWSFMRTLPADELAQTYGWYQTVLNLRAAELYAERGLGLLRELKEKLPLRNVDKWTTESLLGDLEQIAQGFQQWAERLQKGGK